jgi:hypothetical protein
MRWAVHVTRIDEERNAHKFMARKPEGKGKLGKRRLKCEDNIKIYLKKIV